MAGTLNLVFLLLGSNIAPETNVPAAIRLLKQYLRLQASSSIWETPSVGSPGPNFWNLVVCVETSLDAAAIKNNVITIIEHQLGRVRSTDKNAPRTIDIDIILFNDEIFDQHIWDLPHIAVPLSELLPHLQHPEMGIPLQQIAHQLLAAGGLVHKGKISGLIR